MNNPTHDCPVFGKDCIVPRCIRVRDGVETHMYKCVMCGYEVGDVPNPGSREAQDIGCVCPVMDNHYGKGRPDGDFIYRLDCPVHGEEEKSDGNDNENYKTSQGDSYDV